MAFPELDCEMIAVMSELGDIPDDLDLEFDNGCFYHRIALGEQIPSLVDDSRCRIPRIQ